MLYSCPKKDVMNLNEMENELIRDRNYHKTMHMDRDPKLFNKLFFSILALFVLNCGFLFSATCPYCHEEIEVICGKGWVFPDTWTCPSCGYENYEGVTSCALCGTRGDMIFIIDGEEDN